jgi:hypothetical protein
VREGALCDPAIAAKATGRNHVGIDCISKSFLVGTAIGREWATQRGGERLAGMATLGARVRDEVDIDRRQGADSCNGVY